MLGVRCFPFLPPSCSTASLFAVGCSFPHPLSPNRQLNRPSGGTRSVASVVSSIYGHDGAWPSMIPTNFVSNFVPNSSSHLRFLRGIASSVGERMFNPSFPHFSNPAIQQFSNSHFPPLPDSSVAPLPQNDMCCYVQCQASLSFRATHGSEESLFIPSPDCQILGNGSRVQGFPLEAGFKVP